MNSITSPTIEELRHLNVSPVGVIHSSLTCGRGERHVETPRCLSFGPHVGEGERWRGGRLKACVCSNSKPQTHQTYVYYPLQYGHFSGDHLFTSILVNKLAVPVFEGVG